MSQFPPAALSQHIAVLGKTGSGKSYAVRGIVEGLLDGKARVCMIDPTGTWNGLRSSATGKSPGYPVVIFGGNHADLPLSGTHGEAIAEIIGTTSTPAIIDTSLMKVGERTRFFADFADALVRKNKGPLHLVIDEAHLFAPQGKVNDPQSGAMLHAANNLVSLGRSRGLRIILITQRPAKLHKDSLTQVETLVAMRLIAPQDRKAVEEWIKDNADEAKGREIIVSLATLKTGQAWVWAPELGILERIAFPKIKTFDSGRAPDGSEAKGQVLAPIDREAIAQQLKTVAADALANDPAALKKRIAELERQAKQVTPAAVAIEPSAIYRARNDGYQEGMAAGINKGRAEIVDRLEVAYGALDVWFAHRPTMPMFKLDEAPRPTVVRTAPVKAPVTTRQKTANGAGSSDLSAPRQKILDQLAWLESMGLYPAPKETLAAVCRVSPTSGGYFNNLGALRSAGLVEYPQSGMVAFTDEGRAAANASNNDGREVHEHWLDIVSAPQRAILAALIKRHPNAVGKDELAGQVNVSSTSGGYFNNLGRLRTLGAIDYPAPGQVHLTRYVMP